MSNQKRVTGRPQCRVGFFTKSSFFSLPSLVLIAASLALFPRGVVAADSDSVSQAAVPSSFQFTKVYIPFGFDDNDNIEIVGEGQFSNPCDRPGRSTARVNAQAKTIEILGRTKPILANCGPSEPFFHQTLEIGQLEMGDYVITQEGRQMGILNVAHSQNAAQDSSSFLPLSTISVDKSAENHWVLHMKGEFPSNCVDFKTAKVDVQPDVILVLPITRLWEFGCRDVPLPFDIALQLPDGINPGRYLLHVRAAHGKSVNEVFDLN